MGVKTRAIASLTMASILVASAGLASNFASAAYDENGDYIPTPEATCAELQDAINNTPVNDYDGFSSVQLSESCSANLVIPSGKKVKLSLWPDHNLTNDGGDTITVEEGAVFYYDGTGYDSIISNTTNGKAIINNHGLVRLFEANLKAENGAYTTINSGELNILVGGNYTGTKISNTGTLRITDGTFDNTNEIKPYVVNGRKIDESTNEVISSLLDGEEPLSAYNKLPYGIKLPVGYTFTLKTPYADYADAFNARFESNGVLEVTGSNQEGWTFTITSAGMFSYVFRLEYYGTGAGPEYSYEIPSNIKNDAKDIVKDLVNKFFEVIQKAVEDGKTISLDLEIDNKTNVTSEEKTEVAKVTGEDKVIGYYNIELALNGDGEKLTNVTDLEDEEMEVRLPANFVDDLEKVAEGYTRNYYIVRLHDGVAEKINAKIEGKELVFKSGKFSTYAVAYTDTKTSDTPIEDNKSDLDDTNKGDNNSNTDTKTPDTPNTGVLAYITSDGARVTALGVLVAAVISGLVASVVIARKRQKNSK